jgi:hypothetical protein
MQIAGIAGFKTAVAVLAIIALFNLLPKIITDKIKTFIVSKISRERQAD